MRKLVTILGLLVLAALALGAPSSVTAQGDPMGIVIMHGKGGSPGSKHIAAFAQRLEGQGYLIANLDMPWSGRRNYDVPVSRAEEEVSAAVAGLRAKGARKVFVAGHSQGGGFALHIAGKLAVDGVIAIAPGGSVAGAVYLQNLGDSVARARQLTSEGKGNEPVQLYDYEGSRGTYPIVAVPVAYVTWFDPEGAMNIPRAARAVNPQVPILFIIPKRDYPGLLKSSPSVFRALPSNPLTRLYEPSSDHLNAPVASVDEIVRWTREVASAPQR